MSRGRKKKLIETNDYYSAVDNMNMNDTLKELRKLGKRANQRLVELEKHDITMPKAEAFYFLQRKKGATISDIQSGKVKLRFQENIKTYEKQLIEKYGSSEKALTAVKNELLITYRFLESKSSTMRGRKQLAKENLNRFKGKIKEKFNMKENEKLSVSDAVISTFLSELNSLKSFMKFEYTEAMEDFMVISKDKKMTVEEAKKFVEEATKAQNPLRFRKNFNAITGNKFKESFKKRG